MGMSMTVHTEVKIGGVWHHYGRAEIHNNRELFDLLAGVGESRTPPPKIDDPRGLPPDVSELTRLDAARHDDYHSHSWIGRIEIERVHRHVTAEKWTSNGGIAGFWLEGWLGTLFGYQWCEFNKVMQYAHFAGLNDVRWVFWFDN